MNTDVAAADIGAPPCRLFLLETRALLAWPAFRLRTLSLAGLPHGDGHAVIVIPGLGASDITTRPLRRALAGLGYAVSGWECGLNLGSNARVREALNRQLERRHAGHGPVSLIGWSLGGILARELARHHPEKVRQVITLGSPFAGNPAANNLRMLLKLANAGRDRDVDLKRFRRLAQPPPVPCTALHTRSDGIVNWRCCLEPTADNTRNIEVHGSHVGLVFSTEVLHILAQLLARPPFATRPAAA